MPVTRSSSRHASQQPPSSPHAARRAGPSGSRDAKKLPSNKIIVLSSDDDEPPPKGTVPSKKTAARLSRKKAGSSALVNPSDILEISSDDEGRSKKPSARKQLHPSEATNRDLRRTIRKLQEDLKRAQQRLVSSSLEVEELKRNGSDKNILSGLGEYTCCEVCTLTMWCPYTLPQCGHSFCESCLVDWFSTTQAQYLTSNPQLDNNRAALAGHIRTFIQLVPNLHAYGQHGQLHVRAVLAELRRHRPEYTCPSCRKEVLNKPIEDFRLKDLVREIAGRMGETEPHKDAPSYRGSGPFEDFFAAPILTT